MGSRDRSLVRKAIGWLDDYTKPRTHTAGNFSEASKFQAAFQGGTEGFYLWGLPGVVAGAGSATLGTIVQNKSGSQILGVITGTAVGAAAGYVISLVTGDLTAVPTTAVLGLFQTVRAHGKSEVRDSGGNATMISAGLAGAGIPGLSKIGGGLGAVTAVRLKEKLEKIEYLKDKPKLMKAIQAAVGAVSGAASGVILSTLFSPPVGLATVIGFSAAAGAVGPFFGPRFSQFFRNVAEDAGKGAQKIYEKIKNSADTVKNKALTVLGGAGTGAAVTAGLAAAFSLPVALPIVLAVGAVAGAGGGAWLYKNAKSGDELAPATRNAVGSLPASVLKEGVRGYQYSGGSLSGFVLCGIMETVQQAQIALCAKPEEPKE